MAGVVMIGERMRRLKQITEQSKTKNTTSLHAPAPPSPSLAAAAAAALAHAASTRDDRSAGAM